MLEIIRNYLMKRMTRKRTEVTKWNHLIGPKVIKYMKRLKIETDSCHVYVCFGELVIFV